LRLQAKPANGQRPRQRPLLLGLSGAQLSCEPGRYTNGIISAQELQAASIVSTYRSTVKFAAAADDSNGA